MVEVVAQLQAPRGQAQNLRSVFPPMTCAPLIGCHLPEYKNERDLPYCDLCFPCNLFQLGSLIKQFVYIYILLILIFYCFSLYFGFCLLFLLGHYVPIFLIRNITWGNKNVFLYIISFIGYSGVRIGGLMVFLFSSFHFGIYTID